MYSKNKWGITFYTNRETPCSSGVKGSVCVMCYCATVGRGGEKGGSANSKTKHSEPLTSKLSSPLYSEYKVKHGTGLHEFKDHKCLICEREVELEGSLLSYHFKVKHSTTAMEYYKKYIVDGYEGKPAGMGVMALLVTCNIVPSVTHVLGTVIGTKLLLRPNLCSGNCN